MRREVTSRIQACAMVLSLLSAAAAGDVVQRRGGEGDLSGERVGMDDAGISIRSDSGAVHMVPWDHVRDVRSEFPDPRLEQHLAVAEELWRARSRLERSDAALAEPVFDRLFPQYRGRSHTTALLVAEGLLRCRLARADQPAAVIPALEVTRLRRAGITTDRYTTLPPVWDADLELCTHLPPAWTISRGLQKLAGDLRAYQAQGDEVVDALRWWYLRSVEDVLPGEEAASAEPAHRDHQGVELLATIVQARAADPALRQASRRWLAGRTVRLPAWAEAWARYGSGVSLLLESDVLDRQRGVVSLSYLPARFSRVNRYLSAVALARMAEALAAMGDAAGAAALRAELERSSLGLAIAAALLEPANPASPQEHAQP